MYYLKLFPVFVLILAVLAGCQDNPVSGDEEEHADVFSAELVLDETVLVTIREGVVHDTLRLHAGETTGFIRTRFYDEGGDPVDTRHLDEEAFGLGLSMVDTSVAAVERREDETWAFRLVGRRTGETTMRLAVVHEGEEDHADFGWFDIPVIAE